MGRPIWYRVRSELRAHAARSVAATLVVAVVGGFVLTLTAGALRTTSAPDRYSDALGDAYDVSLEQYNGRPRTSEIAALPAVATVDVAAFVFGGVAREGADPVEGFVFAGTYRAFAANIVAGREPNGTAPGEFVATRAWLTESGARLGDQFALLTITQEQADKNGFDVTEPDGPTLPATLVGVIEGPSDLEDTTPLALFGPELLDAGDIGVSSSVGLVALTPGATIDDLREQLDALPSGDAFAVDPAQLVPDEVRSAVRVQGQGLAVVAAIVAVAAIAVLGQLLSRQTRLSAAQRRAVTAMGFTRTQVVADPLCSAALPIVAGSLVAAVLAFAASGAFPQGYARRVEPSPGVRFEPLVHGLGAVVLALVIVMWVLLALALGDRDDRAAQRQSLAETWASRFGPGPAATGLRFALTRHPRDPGSLRARIVGLVLVLTALIGALTFGSSVNRFLDEPARFGYNFDLATGVGGDAVPEEVRALLEQDPDVADVTLYGTLLSSVGSTSLDVTGMQRVRGSLEPDLLSGRLPQSDDEMILGRVAASELNVDVGDEIAVSGAQGPVPFSVTGLAVIPSIEGGDGIGAGGVVTLDGLRRLDPAAALGSAAVRLRPDAQGAATRLAEMLGGAGLPDRPPAVVKMERVRSTPFIVAGALAALAMLSMFHQLLTSARRRRRDLAVFRALGADRRWLSSVLHWQGTVLAAVVVVMAVPLGIAAGRLVYEAYIDRIGARTDLSVPYAVLAAVVLSLVVLGNVAAAVPARQVRHDVPARVLTGE